MKYKAKAGALVCTIHNKKHRGIIMEVNPMQTRTDHPDRVCRVQWFDGDESFEFTKTLEILSEGR